MRYATGCKLDRLILYRNWFFGVRTNAPRSGCPISLTLEALGDRWSLIVIRDQVRAVAQRVEVVSRKEVPPPA